MSETETFSKRASGMESLKTEVTPIKQSNHMFHMYIKCNVIWIVGDNNKKKTSATRI